MDAADLTDFIFKAALAGCGCDVKAHKKALWDAAVTLLSDVLRHTDEISRERLLRGLVPELRASMDRLEHLLTPYPRPPQQVH